jgi:hypothetical protein
MTEQETFQYVKTTAVAMQLPLTDMQAQRVAEHLQRTVGMVAALNALPLLPEHELAEIYCPAPWPTKSEEAA